MDFHLAAGKIYYTSSRHNRCLVLVYCLMVYGLEALLLRPKKRGKDASSQRPVERKSQAKWQWVGLQTPDL